jgi:4-diphosphocytidyl-2-C-methyl-D-erythritol kinase
MDAQRLSFKAPAKINLYLKITGRRPDGYHDLCTLMQKLALYDHLQFTLLPDPGISLHCPGTDLPEDKRNIVFRAARSFLDHIGRLEQGIEIVLTKNIPIAAGLGGGSSDAAAVLLGLDQLLATGCPRQELIKLGCRLGADVPLFIFDAPAAWATGIGEVLKPALPLSGYRVLLVNPGISVSTKWAYETFALTFGQNGFSLSCSQKENAAQLCETGAIATAFCLKEMVNDLETVTAEKYPVINEIKRVMLVHGAAGAMMSGSGSTVFGLFSSSLLQRAEQCRRQLAMEHDQVYLVHPLG